MRTPQIKFESVTYECFTATARQAIGRTRSRFLKDQGSTMVETALIMIVLSMILFGLIEMCLALYTYHFVSDAAREASRYAMVHGSACQVKGVSCTVTKPQIQTYVRNLGFPGIQPTSTVTTTYAAYPAGGTCAPSAACNNPGNLVTVTVRYNFPVSIPFVRSSVLAMSSTSSMVISQ
jgi:Flp pilus assembly protein TadG